MICECVISWSVSLAMVYISAELQVATGISSWEEKARDEITKIVDRFSDSRCIIFPGDFNVGPQVGDYPAFHPGKVCTLLITFSNRFTLLCDLDSHPSSMHIQMGHYRRASENAILMAFRWQTDSSTR